MKTSPANLIHLLKDTYGISDHRMLIPVYRSNKISQKLSFKIRGQSIFLLKMINSATIIRILSTNRSSGLPTSSLPNEDTELISNHLAIGLDPLISTQAVGTQRARKASELRFRSISRSTMTRTTQSMRATAGGIASPIQKATVRDVKTWLSGCSENHFANCAKAPRPRAWLPKAQFMKYCSYPPRVPAVANKNFTTGDGMKSRENG